jgi:hypothetical protein
MLYFLEITLLNFVIFSARYFIIAGLAFVIFYIWKKREFLHRKIQKIFPKNSDFVREVSYSCISLGIFALVGGVFIILLRNHLDICITFTILHDIFLEYRHPYHLP